MCDNYFDVRTFGAVMSTGKAGVEEPADGEGAKAKKSPKTAQKRWNCGQVRGPVQLGFGRSILPILSMEHAITRVALTNADDTGRTPDGDSEERAASGQMGRKHTVPYALYRAHGFVSPYLARDTGFAESDYELLLEAMEHLFDHDRSAARGEMAVRGLGVFEHESMLGNAPSHRLFESIQVEGSGTPRSFPDYKVTGPRELPGGVKFRWIVDPHVH